jgi:hypothetical protein
MCSSKELQCTYILFETLQVVDQPVIWIPALVLAHVFACCWIIWAVYLSNRRLQHQKRRAGGVVGDGTILTTCAADLEVELQGERFTAEVFAVAASHVGMWLAYELRLLQTRHAHLVRMSAPASQVLLVYCWPSSAAASPTRAPRSPWSGRCDLISWFQKNSTAAKAPSSCRDWHHSLTCTAITPSCTQGYWTFPATIGIMWLVIVIYKLW